MHVAVDADEFCSDVNHAARVLGSELVETPDKQTACAFRLVFHLCGFSLAVYDLAGTLFERERIGHGRLDILVGIDIGLVGCKSVTREFLKFTVADNAFYASVKNFDGESDALRADFVDCRLVVCLVVVLAAVVDYRIGIVLAACVSHVDTAEVPNHRHVDRLAVCERDVESGREVDVISVEFGHSKFDVFTVYEFVRSVEIVLDVTARRNGGFLVAIAAIARLSCKDIAASIRIDLEDSVLVKRIRIAFNELCFACQSAVCDMHRYVNGRTRGVALRSAC